MKTKYSIEIKNGEKELYRIFKELERYGRSSFSYKDRAKQQDLARNIGMRGKPLIEQGLFYPPAKTRQHRINIVALPIGVRLIEEKGKKISRFLIY